MNRIDKAFRRLPELRRKAFIAYLTAGDPDLRSTVKAVLELERSGADIIELGIPFSDPIADGPTIQEASARALASGTTIAGIFATVKKIRASTGIPLVFMTYYNPILRHGLAKFFSECRRYGIDGVIVPDLPVEEAGDMIKRARANGVATIFLAAPTSTGCRIKKIAAGSRGFIYYVSLTGVTGSRKALPKDIGENIKRIKSITNKPVAVGFGVSDPRQALAVARLADGVIVGSAIVKMVSSPGLGRFASAIAEKVHSA